MATQKKISQLPEVLLVGDDDLLEVSVKTGPSSYVSRMVKAKYILPSGVVTPSGLIPSGVVFDTGDQTIGGVKTFESFPITPSGAPTTDLQVANKKYVDDNAGGGGGAADWTTVEASKYTATPASTSVITMSDTSNFKVGLPVKYTYNSNTYFGRVQALSTNASITIQGPPLNTGQALTALYAGKGERQGTIPMFVAGTFGDGTDSALLANDMQSPLWWNGPKAYLVAFTAVQKTADSGAEPKINVNIGGSAVSTNDTNKGLQLSATAGTRVSTGVDINPSNYALNDNDLIELACTEAGGTGDALNLSVQGIYVLE